MMTADDFRRVALDMPDAFESAHMDHPDFRVNGRVFATIYPDNARGMVKLPASEQDKYIHAYPSMFAPAAGAWGRQGCTTVLLESATEATVRKAMTAAWKETSDMPAPRRSRPTQTTTRRRP